jgi:plastocyanin
MVAPRLATIGVVFASVLAGQAKQDQAKQGPSGAYQQAARLPARSLDFKATPASIQPGQAVTLVWAAENPNSVSIDPEIGNVTARGSRQVKPSATTTYTLTVRGPNGDQTRSLKITVAGTVERAATASATAATKATPRMVDGKPDLSGVYNSSSFNFGGAQVRGQNTAIAATLKPGAEKFKVVRGPNDPGQFSDCKPTGVPGAYFVPYQWEIVQGRDRVVIVYEYPHLFRVIPTDGTPHPADPDPTWMGDSVGRWEGDTLVVDTVGFNDKTELPGGYKHTESLHVVEHFHRTDFNNLDYEATIDDPNVFDKPWTIARGFPLRPDLTKVDEFVCENNHDYSKFFDKK